jgi:predicted nuclease of predicted toxin-antitoxin system
MNKLFIELYLDENVSVIVARILRARGVSVLTTDECGNMGKTDEDQMKFAIDNELVLVTMDRIDFEKIAQDHFRRNIEHFGIAIIADNSPQIVAQRLNSLVDAYTADEMKNQIVYL